MDRRRWTALVVASVAVPAAAPASETRDYTYDALGRLTAISVSGGPNGNMEVTTSYDPAGNRSNYSVDLDGGLTAASTAVSPDGLDPAAGEPLPADEDPVTTQLATPDPNETDEPAPAPAQPEEAAPAESPEGGR